MSNINTSGCGGYGVGSELLFFFLLLVVIFCNCYGFGY
ncbi:hypothetical protein HNR33_001930 [Brassicibacter mesophilus]